MNIRSLVLVLTGSIYGVMLFVSSICSAASYPKESVTPLATDLSMNQYKINDIGDIITNGPWVDARAYNGGAFNNTTISAAITAIGSAQKTLLLAPGTWTISANVTVPYNINLRFEQGAVLSLGSTYIFTINGPIDAPLVQIFSGSGTVKFGSSAVEVYPQWWGIDGTYDYNEVQLACNALSISGGIVYCSEQISGSLSSVSIPSNVTIVNNSNSAHPSYNIGSSDAEFVISGPAPAVGNINPALVLQTTGLDGRRQPTIISRYGDMDNPVNTWLMQFGVYGNVTGKENAQANDLLLVSGQGTGYNAGTVTVQYGSNIVTGSGTAWTSNMVRGLFVVESQSYSGTIASVTGGQTLTLTSNWPGASASGQSYRIQGGTGVYRGVLNVGQNGACIFNQFACDGSNPVNYDPISAAEAGYAQVIHGNFNKSGMFNSDTLIRVANGVDGAGNIGFGFIADGTVGDPQKWLYFQKSNNQLVVADSPTSAWITRTTSLGIEAKRSAVTYNNVGWPGSPVVPSLSNGSLIEYYLTNNLTINPPASGDIMVGQRLVFILQQDGTGGHTVTFGTKYKLAGGSYTMTPGGSAKDVIEFITYHPDSHWLEVSRSQDVK